MARRLTDLQRQILLAMLEVEEEHSRDPLRSQIFGNTIAPETVAWKILTRRLQQQGVETSNAELWLDQMISIGFETAESASKMLRSLVENVKRAMRKLAARNILLESLWKAKGRPVVRYTLSPIGRSLAKTLRFKEKCDSEKGRGELIEAALNRLREEKRKEGRPAYATTDEILEELKQTSIELYRVNRDTVEKYWNRKKLGAELKKRGYKLVKKR
ncbi:MAG: hypothetical protein RMJ15_04145 [Nitrososphaerota archaeon]|nr:hypothetical protein [Candidatus Bathyarchaeota archaeon]MDW8022914.1 hypothetical protein [Nitrososphaerota archaeon]